MEKNLDARELELQHVKRLRGMDVDAQASKLTTFYLTTSPLPQPPKSATGGLFSL